MKIKIFTLAIVMFTTWGCTDLVEEPIGVLAPEGFFRNEKDVTLALYGAYGRMAADDYWGRELALAIQLMSDEVDIGNRGTVADRIAINDFNANSANAFKTVKNVLKSQK